MKIRIKSSNLKLIYIIFLTLIFISYFCGFFLKEDSSGGGEIDFSLHIFKNFILFNSNDFFKIDWELYDSTSLPLHYILSKLFLFSENPKIYKFFWFLISIIGFLFFYLIFRKRFKIKNKLNFELIFLASTILLSPYYRTSAYWGLEENLGIILMLITIYLYFSFKEKEETKFFLFTIFFASLTFYSRQSYLFLLVIIFFLLLDKSNFFSKKNGILVTLFIFFLLPTFYFFFQWKGLTPPVARSPSFNLNFNNIPTIFNIYLIYLVPFIIKFISFTKVKLNLNFILTLSIFFVIYFFIFQDYSWTSNGSGILPKLFKILWFNDFFSKILLLLCSYISLIFILLMFYKSIVIILYFFLNLIIFCSIDVVFQEYFDPICMIIILSFCSNAYYKKTFINLKHFIPVYSSIILIGSILYRL